MTKNRKLNSSKLVKEMARERIGKVPGTRVIQDKRKKPPKHKKRDFDPGAGLYINEDGL